MTIQTRPDNGREVRGLRVTVVQGDVRSYRLVPNLLLLAVGEIPGLETSWYLVHVFAAGTARLASRPLTTRKRAERAREGFIHRAAKVADADLARTDWQALLDSVPV